MTKKRRRFLGMVPLMACLGAGDGRLGEIAYLAHVDGYWQVWVMAADGVRARQVTRSEVDKTVCSWLPNGLELLVNSSDGRVSRVAIESGEITEVPLPYRGVADAVLSPDGKRIAFSLSTSGSVDDNEIWVIDLDGTHPRRLTDRPWLQHAPRWGIDSRSIYFSSGDGKQSHDIWRIAADGSASEQLTVHSLYNFGGVPGPDGQLAFSSNRTGNYELFVRTGAEDVQWTDHPALDGSPSWGPSGEELVFHSVRSGTIQVYRLRGPRGEPQRLTDHSLGARDPVWWVPRVQGKR